MVRPATTTTSHSSPLAACTVISCTGSASRLGHLDLEAALPLLGGVEVGEEREQAGVLAGGDELLRDLDQPVDVEQRVGRA